MAAQPDSDAPKSAAAGRPKVIYVMGAGRSGTTILGVTLGNCADFMFAGELNQWLAKSGSPTHHTPERDDFWAAIRGQVDGADGLFGGRANRMERSSALFDVRTWPARRRMRAAYRRISESVYLAVARTAGVGNVIDTSHYPARAREMQHLQGIDLYLLYVARDPHGVVASLNRDDVPERSFNMPTTNAYLWLTHLFSVLVFLRQPRSRRLFLQYEDFMEDPEGVLRQILDWAGSSAELPDLSSLHTGLPIHGNRLVASSTVALQRGNGPPPARSLMTTVIQLPWTFAHSLLRPAARAAGASPRRSGETVSV